MMTEALTVLAGSGMASVCLRGKERAYDGEAISSGKQPFDDGRQRCYRLPAISPAVMQKDYGARPRLFQDGTGNGLDAGTLVVRGVHVPQCDAMAAAPLGQPGHEPGG